MTARTAITITLTAFLAVFALTIVKGINDLAVTSYRFISPNDIRGMAIVHQGMLYTLNFDQQNDLVEAFNMATPIVPDSLTIQEPPARKVVIYRFNAPDMHVELVGFLDNSPVSQSLIFKNQEWFPGFLSTQIPDSYSAMLSNTYDHNLP